MNNIVYLIVGHNQNARGASNEKYPELNEYDVNKKISDYLRMMCLSSDATWVFIDGTHSLTEKINIVNNRKEHYDNSVLVEMHFNAFNGYISNSSGAEILIPKSCPESANLAQCLLDEFSAIKNINRGIIQISKPQRGWPILENAGVQYRCIAEPLFIDSEEGENLLNEDFIYGLASMYYVGIINFLERL